MNFNILDPDLKAVRYKYSGNGNPSGTDPEVDQIWTENDGTTTISTVRCKDGKTPVMKSLRIDQIEGVPIQVAEVNIYAAGS